MAYLVQNFSLIIFMKSILVCLVPPTHKLAKTVEKNRFSTDNRAEIHLGIIGKIARTKFVKKIVKKKFGSIHILNL